MIHPVFGPAADIVAMTVVGLVFGGLYFMVLGRTVALLVAGGNWLGATALTLGRIAAAVVALTVAAKFGAFPLLAAFAGFLFARMIAVRIAKRAR